MRILAPFFLFSLLLQAPAPKPLQLAEVHSIYVEPVGGELRNFLMIRIAKWKDITLARSPEGADAILKGAAETSTTYDRDGDGDMSKNSVYQGEFLLIDRRTEMPIWSTEKGRHASGWAPIMGSSFGKPKSPSRLADEVIAQLQKDWQSSQPRIK